MTPSVPELLDGLRSGNRRALARSITLVENASPASIPAKAQLLDALAANQPETVSDTVTGSPNVRIGISGTPGVGKSTLIEAIGVRLIERGHRVAVLAVDPTSARTGGSILGDKTRMPQLAVHSDAFVRPSPAGSGLGGITGSTAAAVNVCEAGGFDVILVETVGVGQSETAVAGVTDLFLLLHSPGGGDELQGIKRGVMELADRVAVTKADGDLLPAANRAALELKSALHLMRPKPGRGMTPVDLCSSVTGDGLDDVIDGLFVQHAEIRDSGELARLRATQRQAQFEKTLDEGLKRRTAEEPSVKALRDDLEAAVGDGSISPAGAAHQVLSAAGPSAAAVATELNAVTLLVSDMGRSASFYKALGFPVVFGGEADAGFTTLAHGHNFLNLQLATEPLDIHHWGRPIFFVPDPDSVYANAVSAGLEPHAPPQDAPWGERYFHITDPDGHELSFARRL